MRIRAILVLVLALSAATGCGAPQNKYVIPANLTPQTAASLVGSRLEVPGASSNARVYHAKIDGALTLAGPGGWNEKVLLSPGAHTIIFGIQQGGFLSGDYFGFGRVQANFQAGKTYMLRAAVVNAEERRFLGWIEDGEGQTVSDKAMVAIGLGRQLGAPLLLPPHK